MKPAVLLALGTLIALGGADFLRKVAVSRGAEALSFFAAETIFILLWTGSAILLLRRPVRLEPPTVGLAALSGLLVAVGIVAMLLALGLGEASRAVPIARLGMILTVTLAVLILREPVTPTKLLGLGFGILAVVLLSR